MTTKFGVGDTVGDLINALQTYPPDTKVMRHDGQCYQPMRNITLADYTTSPGGFKQTLSSSELRVGRVVFKGINIH